MEEIVELSTLNNEACTIQSFNFEWKKYYTLIECVMLFFIAPIALYWFRHFLAFRLVPVLLLLALGCMIYIASSKEFELPILWNTRNFLSHIKQILITLIGIGIAIGTLTYLFFGDRFLVFPINRPHAALTFVLLYPLLAALPQEIIFKCFFFHRYRSIFPGPLPLIFFNGLSFGLFHLWYGNFIAPILSIFAGMILAYRYLQTKSLLLVSIEHGLMGILLYVVGMGWFFYSGSIQ